MHSKKNGVILLNVNFFILMIRILIDISDFKKGYSGITHDLIGHIKILQNLKYVQVDFLFVDYYKRFPNEVEKFLREFCSKEGLEVNSLKIIHFSNYLDKLSKIVSVPIIKLTGESYDYIFVQSDAHFRFPKTAKIIVRLHDLIYLTHPTLIKNSWLNKIFLMASLKNLIKNNATFIANSEYTIGSFKKFFDNYSNLYKINCPIRRSNYGEIDIKIKNKFDYIITCATLEPKKNLIFLCDVFEEFNKLYPQYKLIIIGKEGWEYQSIKARIETTKNILWYKSLDDANKDYLIENSKCFVFPSIIEGFGIPPLEAMELNVPVLSSDIPIHREIQGENSWYAKLGDISDFKTKLAYIISHRKTYDVQKRISTASNFVKKYNIENTSQLWDGFFRRNANV